MKDRKSRFGVLNLNLFSRLFVDSLFCSRGALCLFCGLRFACLFFSEAFWLDDKFFHDSQQSAENLYRGRRCSMQG